MHQRRETDLIPSNYLRTYIVQEDLHTPQINGLVRSAAGEDLLCGLASDIRSNEIH